MTLALDSVAGTYWPVQGGGYDLSGAIYDYASVPGLVAGMQAVGFSSWRVGLGRWEIGSELLANVPGAGNCPVPAVPSQRSVHTTLTQLLAERDYFQLTVDHGTPGVVDQTDLDEPLNYHFDYLDRVLAQAEAFGAEPYLDIDIIPSVLARNRTPSIADCNNTFRNAVSTSPPFDNNVYAYTVIQAVRHVLDGWPNGTPTHAVKFVEIGNEPDALDNFWSGTAGEFNAMYIAVATALANVRAMAPANSPWKNIRIGGGSFAVPAGHPTSFIPGFLSALDAAPAAPLEFLAFHSYQDNGADVVVDEVNTRLETLKPAHNNRYLATDLVLSEWGPDLSRLGDATFNHSMNAALVHAMGLAGAHAMRFRMTHKSLFYDYLWLTSANAGFSYGLFDHLAQPTANSRAFVLFHEFMNTPRIIDFPAAYPAAGLEGLILAGMDNGGSQVQLMCVNNNAAPRTLHVDIQGLVSFVPSTATASILDGDGSTIRTEVDPLDRSVGYQRMLPGRSVTLLRLQ